MVATSGTARSMEGTIFMGAKRFHKIEHPRRACHPRLLHDQQHLSVAIQQAEA